MEKKWRIGIVIPWFGRQLHGGAEQQAWQIAVRLSQVGCQVQVLTTCSESFLGSWHKNHYKPGLYQEDGLSIRRFALRRRDPGAFNQVVAKLLALPAASFSPGRSPLNQQEEATYWRENISAPDLIAYLKTNSDAYDAFIFMPYLFPTTVAGIEAVGSKALLHACLHDECYAYLRRTTEAVSRCRALLFNSQGEFILAKKIYGDWITAKAFIIGEGIEASSSSQASLSSQASEKTLPALPEKFVLNLGRRCAEKNTPLLLSAFAQYKKRNPLSGLHLVLAGPAELSPKDLGPHTLDLGLVSDADKKQVLAACTALVNPSVNESFSRVIFEAWSHTKPVLVHKDCLATYTAWQEAKEAGWAAQTEDEFVAALQQIDNSSCEDLRELGERGRAYGAEAGSWDKAMQRYLACFRSLSAGPRLGGVRPKKILYIFPFEKNASQASKTYFRDFLSTCHIAQRQGGHVTFLAPHSEAWRANLPTNVHPMATVDEVPAYKPDWVIWQGKQTWPEAEAALRLLACARILRDLTPPQLSAAFLAQFDLTLGAAKPQSPTLGQATYHAQQQQLWLPPLFSYQDLQRLPPSDYLAAGNDTAQRHDLPELGKRVLVLLDITDVKARNFLIALGNLYYATYHQALSISLPIPKQEVKSWYHLAQGEPHYLLLKPFTGKHLKVHIFDCDQQNVFASEIYQAADCLVLLGEPEFSPAQVLAASDFGLTPICVASPYWASFACSPHNFSYEAKDLDPLLALLRSSGLHSPDRQKASTKTDFAQAFSCRREYIPGQMEARFLQALKACSGTGERSESLCGQRQ